MLLIQNACECPGRVTNDPTGLGMDSSNTKLKFAAIATGVALLIMGVGFMYWQVSRRYWCVRTVSTGNQEVTYSWGCMHPQRYRQWSITASAEPRPSSGVGFADQ